MINHDKLVEQFQKTLRNMSEDEFTYLINEMRREWELNRNPPEPKTKLAIRGDKQGDISLVIVHHEHYDTEAFRLIHSVKRGKSWKFLKPIVKDFEIAINENGTARIEIVITSQG